MPHHQQKQHYETIDVHTRTSYERFLEFERLMKMYPPSSTHRFNPTPLGLCAFALTTFILSMYNAGAIVPVTASHGAVMGLALFYGGLIQLLAGLLEFRIGNNFGALAFCSYGGFWLGLASLYVNVFGFLQGLDTATENKALGVFFLGWAIFTAAMFISSLRTNLALVALFFFLTITFILLTVCKFLQGNLDLQRAAGACGILTASIAWYAAFASLLKRGENSYFSLPVYNLAPQTPTVIIVDKPSTNILSRKM
jgi:succinate-acetate transporter protein